MKANIKIQKYKGETYITVPLTEDILEGTPVFIGRRTINGYSESMSEEQKSNARQIVASTVTNKKGGGIAYGIQLLDESNLDQIKSLETWDFELVRELYERYEQGKLEEWDFLKDFEESERERILRETNEAIYEATIRFLPF